MFSIMSFIIQAYILIQYFYLVYLQHFNMSALCLCPAPSALSVAVGVVLRIVWLCSSNLPKGEITHCILVWNIRTFIVLTNFPVYLRDQYKIRIAFFIQNEFYSSSNFEYAIIASIFCISCNYLGQWLSTQPL